MDSFITGFFTLIAALSTVWLTSILNVQKEKNRLSKVKASEAYILSSRLIRFFHTKESICYRVLKNEPSLDLLVNEDDSLIFRELEDLELLILNNFDNLIFDYEKCSKLISDHLLFLINIISRNHKEISIEQFETSCSTYKVEIAIAVSCLKLKLKCQYIQNQRSNPNFYVIKSEFKTFFKEFFKRHEKK